MEPATRSPPMHGQRNQVYFKQLDLDASQEITAKELEGLLGLPADLVIEVSLAPPGMDGKSEWKVESNKEEVQIQIGRGGNQGAKAADEIGGQPKPSTSRAKARPASRCLRCNPNKQRRHHEVGISPSKSWGSF